MKVNYKAMENGEVMDVLDNLIIGRVEPHVYAFTTNTVPNYLKVGDTYRPVHQRLSEWKLHYPDLEQRFIQKAAINTEVYFRDYSVHKYLENDLGKERLKSADLKKGIYFSKEFFKETYPNDIEKAIEDIKTNFSNNTGKYDYYSSEERLPKKYQYSRGSNWALRPNQKEAVDRFLNAIKIGKRNLLMYAVMRFGKSFTALCCGLEMNAKIILVVSAKADVKEEWKKTTETAGNFSDYVFLESDNLVFDENIIDDYINNGKKIVLFLTLQDLQGKNIKKKHKELLKKEIDLLIVDETHFGARAESYGQILNNAGYEKIDKMNIDNFTDDSIDVNEANNELKIINARIRLHLSGTPYRILMGSEFEKEDIISFVQFSDIVHAQKAWDKNNLFKDGINEWDNPYFGFPQMVRFAFNPNKSSREKLENLKKSGITYAFSELFKPLSIERDLNNRHKKFVNEIEILDLLQVIDGSQKDEELFGFLDYDKIKEGKMCRHMVMVLPYCASCDAMQDLIERNKDIFKNLNEYEIINISGLDSSKIYKKPIDIKNKIKECESINKKTLTLTVNRMLTGTTVEQWDTMLYFKDTSSPQEYDQAIFRLQNQYIRTLFCEDKIIKENLKPQTLLVDFDPNRLFRMQEQKSLIYNVNTENNGNSKLKDRIEAELRISPIIMMNKDKIHQVTSMDILSAISDYNNKRSISDEVTDIPVDLSILNDKDIRKTIEQQAAFNSGEGLTIKSNEDDGDELDFDQIDKEINKENDKSRNLKNTTNHEANSTQNHDIKELESKIRTYYQRLLFFSFLSKDKIHSLDDIIRLIDNEENKRISINLSLDKFVVAKICQYMDPFKRSSLDYKLQNISMLSTDDTVDALIRATTAIKRFNRMSRGEFITPFDICDKMVNLLNKDDLINIVEGKRKFLDLASKSGEFAIALFKRLTNDLGYSINDVKNLIVSVPTSPVAYEFTRKFYEIIGLNEKNIIENFNSYDLINDDDVDKGIETKDILELKNSLKKMLQKDVYDEGNVEMKFGAVIGNPPYQKTIKNATQGNNANTVDIYNKFKELAFELADISVLLIPAKEFQRGKENLLDKNLQYLRIYNGSNKESEKNIPGEPSIFGDNVRRIPGDVGVFYWNKKIHSDKIIYQELEIDRTDKILPVRKEYIELALKLQEFAGKYKCGSIRKVCESNFVEMHPECVLSKVEDRKKVVPDGYVKVITNNKAGSGGKAEWFYIKKDALLRLQPELYKVVTASAYPNESLKNIKNIEILEPNEMFGRTKLEIYSSDNLIDAENFVKFLQTDFVKKIIEMTPQKLFYYLPDFNDFKEDIDWEEDITVINNQLIKKFLS